MQKQNILHYALIYGKLHVKPQFKKINVLAGCNPNLPELFQVNLQWELKTDYHQLIL